MQDLRKPSLGELGLSDCSNTKPRSHAKWPNLRLLSALCRLLILLASAVLNLVTGLNLLNE